MIRVAKFANKFVEPLKVEVEEGEDVKLPQLSVISNDKENFNYVAAKKEEEAEVNPLEFPLGSFDIHNNSMFKSPYGFSDGPMEKRKKGVKNSFHCEVCLVELNSYETMKSHVSGAKHMKKALAISKEFEDDLNTGKMTQEDVERLMPGVVVIPNLGRTKKIPTRLHEKVLEAMDPVVGLKYITEYLPSSDQEMEPHYQCELCGSQGQANGMMSHVLGTKHRENFMDTKRGIRNNLSRDALLRAVKPYSENHRRLNDLITTKISDLEYPWPPGKAPWAAEWGGSGVPPVVREAGSCPAEKKPVGYGGSKLPTPDSIRPPSSVEEAIRMLEVGKRITELVMGFSGAGVSDTDARVITVIMDSILNRAVDNLADDGRKASRRPLGGK